MQKMHFLLNFYLQKNSLSVTFLCTKSHKLCVIFLYAKKRSNHRRLRFSVWFVNNRTLLLSLNSTVWVWELYFIKMVPDVLLFRVRFSSKQRRSHGELI